MFVQSEAELENFAEVSRNLHLAVKKWQIFFLNPETPLITPLAIRFVRFLPEFETNFHSISIQVHLDADLGNGLVTAKCKTLGTSRNLLDSASLCTNKPHLGNFASS